MQVQLENAERANKALEATWDSYMTSLERENEQTLASAQGALQWKQIIVDNDVSDIAPEVREGLHMALDAMSVLPGGGVFDWMNAELYEAERNKVMADVSRVMITVPGALPVAKHALDKAMDLYNISKGAELMKLALNAGSLDELIEGMIQHGDEIGEVGEALAKQLSEEATEKATKEATKNVADDVVGGMVEGGTSTVKKVFTDNPYDENGNLKSNIKYQTGEFKYNYETDANGRISNWNTDNLQLTEREGRLNYNADTPGKEAGDHAGHLAGDRFGGSPELDNIVSQSQNVNLSQYKKIENQWAKAISEGKEVTVNVDIKYDGDGLRPIEFNVEYTIDGDFFSQSILN